ncbi:hypothetical protein KGM_208148 [Danaus plexippus plexippus]|uniref:Retrotransposon Copia-like N-terminal domain-containing protein n=1 Tax=Danaus plexippus plexippus TaxID=278856 RepID=A0A212EY24_DANPL|nr:hypothetical protein KGM_208148 [Danaus plexippus plexippus]
MEGNYLVNVPKLKGRENYNEWAFTAKHFLVLEGMDIIKDPAADASDTDNKNTKEKLIMTIDSSLYVHIKDEKT